MLQIRTACVMTNSVITRIKTDKREQKDTLFHSVMTNSVITRIKTLRKPTLVLHRKLGHDQFRYNKD